MVNFLTYASEEQLGYDTTMHRVPNSAGELVIKIGNRWFQTKELLADFSADSLLGRGTRVWRGFFLDAPEAPAVFKDCWAERDCRLEGDVLETLRGEYAKLGPTERNFDDYFLTTIEHGTAKLKLPKTDELLVLTSFGLGPSPQEVTRVQHRSSRWRRHYRISFNEVGTPLCDVVELKDHLRALRDAMIGIEILHKLGYVHRDVSSGNVLLCEERGKLSDLEYCKPFSEVGEHEARIVCHLS
ncbi:hypothetical protein BD779DRAFT_1566012 [Infundibulicybe gibba]|nr:hypothetical protein BD779DRAFT_1566012 [Infundibulicybe gibba]